MNKKGIVIALDFDGTMVTHDFPLVGRELPLCVETLRQLHENGHRFVLNTMRSDGRADGTNPLRDAVEWFAERDIPLIGVNLNPTQRNWTSSPKVFANMYIDDAALGTPLHYYDGHERQSVDWNRIRVLLIQAGLLQNQSDAAERSVATEPK